MRSLACYAFERLCTCLKWIYTWMLSIGPSIDNPVSRLKTRHVALLIFYWPQCRRKRRQHHSSINSSTSSRCKDAGSSGSSGAERHRAGAAGVAAGAAAGAAAASTILLLHLSGRMLSILGSHFPCMPVDWQMPAAFCSGTMARGDERDV